MPNGRSGGFFVSRVGFERLLQDLPSDTVVGTMDSAVTVPEVQRVLDQQVGQREIPIEEQDNELYVVHLGVVDLRRGWDDIKTWLSVDESSPIYASLRQRHVDWIKGRFSDRKKQG